MSSFGFKITPRIVLDYSVAEDSDADSKRGQRSQGGIGSVLARKRRNVFLFFETQEIHGRDMHMGRVTLAYAFVFRSALG